MRYVSVLLILLILGSASAKIAVSEGTSISVEIKNGAKGSETWTGVVINDTKSTETRWTKSTESKFQIQVPNTQATLTLVLLKKNAIPVVRPITPTMIKDGFSIEFAQGATIVGTVANQKDSVPISGGVVSITYDEGEYKFSLPDPDVFSWDIKEDGSFAIAGIPLGEHTVSVNALGYMPASQTLLVATDDQRLELNYLLPKATYINGHTGVYLERSRVIAEIDVMVTPPESQTEEFTTTYDQEKNFRMGPFAEDAELELVAWLHNGDRSRTKNITLPTEKDVVLWLYDWVRIYGTVQDLETGEPIPEFSLVAGNVRVEYEVNDSNGKFNEEFEETISSLSIDAPGYVYWYNSKQLHLGGIKVFDFGTIKLERSSTVIGRVIDRATGEPIKGAEIVKLPDQNEHSEVMKWNFQHVITTSDTDGQFELDGFRADGGKLMVSAEGYSADSFTIDVFNDSLKCELDQVD